MITGNIDICLEGGKVGQTKVLVYGLVAGLQGCSSIIISGSQHGVMSSVMVRMARQDCLYRYIRFICTLSSLRTLRFTCRAVFLNTTLSISKTLSCNIGIP